MMAPARGRTALIPALIALAILGSGCANQRKPLAPIVDSGPPLGAADDIAQQTALLLSSDWGSLIGPAAVPFSMQTPVAAPASAGATGADTVIVVAGITWSVDRWYFGLGGSSQAAYDPEATKLMVALTRGMGTVISPRGNFSFRGSSRVDVRGVSIADDALISSGFVADTTETVVTVVRGAPTAPFYHTEYSGTLVAVKQPKPVADHPWPTSGKVLWSIATDRTDGGSSGQSSAHYDVWLTVFFDGSRTPFVQMSNGNMYRFDLMTGGVARLYPAP